MRLGPITPPLAPMITSLGGTPVATTVGTADGTTVPAAAALPVAATPTVAAPHTAPLPAPAALPELVATLGLPPGDAAAVVVTALIRDGLPLTPEVAQRVFTLWRATDLPTPAAAALLWLGERRIPATPERMRLIQAFRAANPGSDGPEPGTLLLTARLSPNQPPAITAWPWLAASPAQAQQVPATPEPPPDRLPATADDADGAKPTVATRAALLLSVATARFGAVDALVATAGEQVDVTFFSDQPAAVSALASELSALSAALTAAGLLPIDLAARLATAASGSTTASVPGLTRLDVRV